MKSSRLLLLLLCLPIGMASASQAAAAQPRPQALFTFAPALPLTDDTVTFTSTSTAPGTNNRIVVERWDLDADGSYDDGTGAAVSRSFPAAGSYWIHLFVMDENGQWDSGSQIVTLQSRPPPPSPPAPTLLSPFPVVQLAGTVKRRGALIRRLTVKAPLGASVGVRCQGRGCPLRNRTYTARSRTRATDEPGKEPVTAPASPPPSRSDSTQAGSPGATSTPAPSPSPAPEASSPAPAPKRGGSGRGGADQDFVNSG